VSGEPAGERGPVVPNLLVSLSAGLALLGGLIILAAAVLVCVSVSLRWATNNSVPGDFELVQIAVALSAFAFLPYCQLRRGNIVVETFTSWLSPRMLAWLEAAWDLVYAFVAGFLAWRLAVGAWETIANGTTTMISGIPIGWGIAAVAVMAAFLAVTSLLVGVCRLGRQT
jgi:TRAP-type C4-dicarboxylate transport system permease small subunit